LISGKTLAWIAPVALIVGAHFLLGYFMAGNFENSKLEGQLHLTAPFPELTLHPELCLDGSEQHFTGMVFSFPSRSEIDRILINSAIQNDNFIDVHYQLNKREPVRIYENECDRFDGQLTRKKVSLNDRSMFRVEGWVEIKCEKKGLAFSAQVSGCLPETLNNIRK
jgi:hypothetical protein